MNRLINVNIGVVVLLMTVAGVMTGCVSYQPSPGSYKNVQEAQADIDAFMQRTRPRWCEADASSSTISFKHVNAGRQIVGQGYKMVYYKNVASTCEHRFKDAAIVNINGIGLLGCFLMDPTLCSYIKVDNCYITMQPSIWSFLPPLYLFRPAFVPAMRAGRAIEYMRQHQPTVNKRKMFEDIDVNNDGTVSRDEYTAYWEAKYHKEGMTGSFKKDIFQEYFSKCDVNNDDRLTKEELIAGARK